MHYKEIILFMHLHTKKYSLQLRLEPTLLQNIHEHFFSDNKSSEQVFEFTKLIK